MGEVSTILSDLARFSCRLQAVRPPVVMEGGGLEEISTRKHQRYG